VGAADDEGWPARRSSNTTAAVAHSNSVVMKWLARAFDMRMTFL
jgi:hypothetical protein